MRLRIRSDGTFAGTRVEDADTGEMVEGVTRVAWHLDGILSRAVIVLEMVEVDVVAGAPCPFAGWLGTPVKCHVVDNPGQQS